MNYNDFNSYVENRIKALLPEAVTVDIRPVIKNNGTRMDGLMILEPGCNIAPTIYLNCYYSEYEEGRSLEDIVREIIAVYKENALDNQVDMSFFLDYSQVKDRITYRLINYHKNRELLTTIPHVRFLDLAVVFQYLINVEGLNNATILIHNEHTDKWEVNATDLFSVASINTPKLLKHEFRNMLDYLKSVNCEYIPDGLELGDIEPDDIVPMYILSNFAGLYGAGCILYKDVLRKFADYMESDLFILPSSVHEVIIVPSDVECRPEQFREMVADVNANVVSKEEILSDTVYYYSLADDQISIYAA